jgi:hypothetical protein
MKFAALLLLAGGLLSAVPAFAQCEQNVRLNRTQLDALLQPANSSLVLVCGRPAAGYTGYAADRWQEEHNTGGASGANTPLFDFKLGANAVDPRKQVGTWRNNDTGNNATVTHTYGALSFTWSVHGPTGNTNALVYHFCSGTSPVVKAFVLPNVTTGCAGVFPPP